jgi:hypothetical protein
MASVLERRGIVDLAFDGGVHGVHGCVYACPVVVFRVGCLPVWGWHCPPVRFVYLPYVVGGVRTVCPMLWVPSELSSFGSFGLRRVSLVSPSSGPQLVVSLSSRLRIH